MEKKSHCTHILMNYITIIAGCECVCMDLTCAGGEGAAGGGGGGAGGGGGIAQEPEKTFIY